MNFQISLIMISNLKNFILVIQSLTAKSICKLIILMKMKSYYYYFKQIKIKF